MMRWLFAPIISLAVPASCFAMTSTITTFHVRGAVHRPTHNAVFHGRLDTVPSVDGANFAGGEIRAFMMRRSRRACYQVKLTGVGNAAVIELGERVDEKDYPLALLPSLGDGTSGTCVKVPDEVIKLTVKYNFVLYAKVLTPTTGPAGVAFGSLKRVAWNVRTRKMKAIFMAEIPAASADPDPAIALADTGR